VTLVLPARRNAASHVVDHRGWPRNPR
jgi:hypothetical protein